MSFVKGKDSVKLDEVISNNNFKVKKRSNQFAAEAADGVGDAYINQNLQDNDNYDDVEKSF